MRAHRIHPLLTGLVQTALKACEGVRFHPGIICRSCGSPRSGYDERKKRFAVLLEDDKPRPLHVIIQRSYCRSCGKISNPQEPFYPDTRVGSPVVDLCRSLSATMPYSQVSACAGQMGVLVDRWSVRNYARAQLPEMTVVEVFGMQFPVSIIALSMIGGSVQEPGHPDGEDILAACNYPSIPFSTGIRQNEDAAAILNQEEQQKIIDRFVNRFSRSLIIVFICFSILANVFSGTASCFSTGLIEFTGLDLEVMTINSF